MFGWREINETENQTVHSEDAFGSNPHFSFTFCPRSTSGASSSGRNCPLLTYSIAQSSPGTIFTSRSLLSRPTTFSSSRSEHSQKVSLSILWCAPYFLSSYVAGKLNPSTPESRSSTHIPLMDGLAVKFTISAWGFQIKNFVIATASLLKSTERSLSTSIVPTIPNISVTNVTFRHRKALLLLV